MGDEWQGRNVLVLGLGETGLSCIRWLARHGARIAAADTREAPPALGALGCEHPQLRVTLGPFDDDAPGGRGRGRCESGPCAPRTGPARGGRARHRGGRRRRDLRSRGCGPSGPTRARSDRHQRQVHRDLPRRGDGARGGTARAGDRQHRHCRCSMRSARRRRRASRTSGWWSCPATSSRRRVRWCSTPRRCSTSRRTTSTATTRSRTTRAPRSASSCTASSGS